MEDEVKGPVYQVHVMTKIVREMDLVIEILDPLTGKRTGMYLIWRSTDVAEILDHKERAIQVAREYGADVTDVSAVKGFGYVGDWN